MDQMMWQIWWTYNSSTNQSFYSTSKGDMLPIRFSLTVVTSNIYLGPTLVIINPYATIEKLFNESILQEYQAMVFTDNLEYKSLPPHVFALAAFCLWQLFDNERSQSIVISGESGAGKT